LGDSLPPKHIHLIRSTYRVIGKKGARRLSLQHVADEAAVSKGLVLYYFKTKEGLILATMRWVLSRVALRIREAIAGAGFGKERILAMIDAIFVSPESNRQFYLTYLDLLEYGARSEKFGELSVAFQTIVNGLYAEVIATAAQEAGIEMDETAVREAASVVRAIIDGLFLQWLQERDGQSTHLHYREQCKRAILQYLRLGPA